MRCHFDMCRRRPHKSSYDCTSSINLNVARHGHRPASATASSRSASVNDERCSLAVRPLHCSTVGSETASLIDNWKTGKLRPFNSCPLQYSTAGWAALRSGSFTHIPTSSITARSRLNTIHWDGGRRHALTTPHYMVQWKTISHRHREINTNAWLSGVNTDRRSFQPCNEHPTLRLSHSTLHSKLF